VTIREIIKREGGPTAFARGWNIPLRTVEKWNTGERKPPEWLPPVFVLAIKAEGRKKK
jgi:DNA-binding transcriptional regulator YiaG